MKVTPFSEASLFVILMFILSQSTLVYIQLYHFAKIEIWGICWLKMKTFFFFLNIIEQKKKNKYNS